MEGNPSSLESQADLDRLSQPLMPADGGLHTIHLGSMPTRPPRSMARGRLSRAGLLIWRGPPDRGCSQHGEGSTSESLFHDSAAHASKSEPWVRALDIGNVRAHGAPAVRRTAPFWSPAREGRVRVHAHMDMVEPARRAGV